METNDILKEFFKTKKFLEVAKKKGINLEDCQGDSFNVNTSSPFVQTLRKIAENAGVYTDEKMFDEIKKNLLNL